VRVATGAVNDDHLIPDSLDIVAGAEKLAKALTGHGELFLHASLEANVDGCFLFLELLRNAGIFMRSSGDWRYSPTACAADIVGAAMAGAPMRDEGIRRGVVVVVSEVPGPAVYRPFALCSHHMRGASLNIRHATRNLRSRTSPKVLRRYLLASRTNTVRQEDCDVVIVGGGPAGLALASALGA
jgi:hypothetical protein